MSPHFHLFRGIRLSRVVRVLTLFGLLIFVPTSGEAQMPNLPEPLKADWGEADDWPGILPGMRKVRPIQPYRAVYERVYRGGSRQDRYIWSVEDIAWHGESALAIRLVDSGNTKWADATARVHERYVRKDNLGLLFAVYPRSGGFTDYWVVRHSPLQYLATLVDGKGNAQQNTMGKNIFDAITTQINERNVRNGREAFELRDDTLLFDDMTVELALGAMELKLGMGFVMIYHDVNRSDANVRIFRVAEKTTVRDKKGKRHKCWAVDSPTNIQIGEVHRYFIGDKPPYFLGRQVLNLLDGKTRPYITLAEYQLLKG